MANQFNTQFDPCEPENLTFSSNRGDIMITNKEFLDINPLLAGQRVCEPDHSYGPSVRSYYLLHFVVSGKGTFITEKKEYSIEKGQIFVAQPNKEIFYKADSKQPWHYRWLGFECRKGILPEFLSSDVVSAPEAEYIFRSVMDAERYETGKEYYIASKLFELFALLSQKVEPRENKPYLYVQMAKNYLESNYNDNVLTISFIADNLNLDRCYLSTIFKEHMGVSPQQYLQDFRLNQAAKMLSSNKYKVLEIAHSCGYNSSFHFSKMFKAKFGSSPQNYK